VDFTPSLKQVQHAGLNTDVQVLYAEIYRAEVALKQSKTRGYYKIIHIAHNASKANMKTVCWHKRLLHYLSKGGKQKTLKPMAKAYAVLSDPQHQQLHDFGKDEDHQSSMGGNSKGNIINRTLYATYQVSHKRGHVHNLRQP
jgi:DnaJ family protein C protein 7